MVLFPFLYYFWHISSEWTDEWKTSTIRQRHRRWLFSTFFAISLKPLNLFSCFSYGTSDNVAPWQPVSSFLLCLQQPEEKILWRYNNVSPFVCGNMDMCVVYHGHLCFSCCVCFMKTKHNEDTCLVIFLLNVISNNSGLIWVLVVKALRLLQCQCCGIWVKPKSNFIWKVVTSLCTFFFTETTSTWNFIHYLKHKQKLCCAGLDDTHSH